MRPQRLENRGDSRHGLSAGAGKTPYAIAQELGRPPKTVMREIRGRAAESDKGAVGRVNNRCAHRYECTRRDVCKACYQRRSMLCKFCRQCNSHCPDYIEDRCARLESSPFVCNGCKDRNRCTLRKRFYRNDLAGEKVNAHPKVNATKLWAFTLSFHPFLKSACHRRTHGAVDRQLENPPSRLLSSPRKPKFDLARHGQHDNAADLLDAAIFVCARVRFLHYVLAPGRVSGIGSAARRRAQSSFAAIMPNICRQIDIDLAAKHKNLAAKQRLAQAGHKAYTDADFPVHQPSQGPSLCVQRFRILAKLDVGTQSAHLLRERLDVT